MPRPDLKLVALLVGGTILAGAACAPGRAVVRGNWPDGRLEAPTRGRLMRPVPMAAVPAPAPEPLANEWLPAPGGDDGLSAADLNRRGVLQPVYFGFDRSDIRDEQIGTIQANVAWLMDNPGVRILIEGHCDERGTREYNLALGARRAEAARDFLISMGIAPDRLETVSYGEELPADPGHNERAWTANRRAEFVVVATSGLD